MPPLASCWPDKDHLRPQTSWLCPTKVAVESLTRTVHASNNKRVLHAYIAPQKFRWHLELLVIYNVNHSRGTLNRKTRFKYKIPSWLIIRLSRPPDDKVVPFHAKLLTRAVCPLSLRSCEFHYSRTSPASLIMPS